MGTRADFYVGRGESAEWLGSIGRDGYPEGGHPEALKGASSEKEYRERVEALLTEVGDDATRPEHGWPWPWEDSRTTDYAYAWNEGVQVSRYGRPWALIEDVLADGFEWKDEKSAVFPNMTARMNVRLDGGSGVLIFG